MQISLAGAQSTGKTTLLQALKKVEEFEHYTFVDEVTRKVNKMGLDINNKSKNYDLTQSLIMNEHIINSFKRNVIVDRGPLDGIVYTRYLYNHGKVSLKTYDWALEVFDRIKSRYDIFFITDPSLPIVDDGQRSTDSEFKDEIVELFEHFTKNYLTNTLLIKGSVNERVKAVLNHINYIQEISYV
jgi:nicotinamide riboside kinase